MKGFDNTQYIRDHLQPGAYRLSDQGSVPDILLRGVMPATEAEMQAEMAISGSVFLDGHGRIISPEFVTVDPDGRIYVDIERAKRLAQAATQPADNNRRWHVIEPKSKKQKPVPRQPQAGMPRPKLLTMNVWRALSQMGALQ
jgi:hypothetical protein